MPDNGIIPSIGGDLMSRPYQRELDFTLSLLERMRIPVHFIRAGEDLTAVDGGLRALLGISPDYEYARQPAARSARERTIHKLLDPFLCHYVYLHLPDAVPTALVIGPYLTADPSPQDILARVEHLSLPLGTLHRLSDHYAALPVYHDPSAIMAVAATLGEALWGKGAFDMADVNYEQRSALPAAVSISAPIEQENVLQRMRQIEERYAYENELMDIVSKGLTDRAETMMSSVSRLNYQPRVPDPLRNQKNYCIICNTLLRKAAQQGGVHPFHLDSLSGQYARRIENAPTLEAAARLISDMILGYCRLVRTHARTQHSAMIEKALTYISANLSGDLSLTTLARLLRVTPGYLSALFHRETGFTLADHITEQRLKAALTLLSSTRLQVQTVAQLTGFSDPNYFSKRFKRRYGMTPLQYRRERPGPIPRPEA